MNSDNQRASLEDTDELQNFREKWKHELQRNKLQVRANDGNNNNTGRSSAQTQHYEAPTIARRLHAPEEQPEENTFVTVFTHLLLEEPPDFSNEGGKHILELPMELVLHVSAFLEVKSLEKWSEACRSCYIVARDLSLPQYPELCFKVWPLTGPAEFKLYGYNWRSMYLHRPRIRFDGVYISKNHYLRPGQTEGNYYQPVHEVVYYRYLRFFEDAQVICAMTSDPPKQAIQWLRHPPAPTFGSVPPPTRKELQTGTYVAEEGEITVWQQMPFYTLCLQLQLSSSKEAANDRLSMLKYSCHNSSGGSSELDHIVVKKFHFAKLPKQYLAMESVTQAQLLQNPM